MRNLGDDIIKGMKEAAAHARGELTGARVTVIRVTDRRGAVMAEKKTNPIGSSFDSFFDEQGIRADVESLAAQEIIADQERLAALDAAIARGIADADAGRVHTSEEVRRNLLAGIGAKPTS